MPMLSVYTTDLCMKKPALPESLRFGLIHFDDRNDCHFFFFFLIHDPFISGFEPSIKLERLFFTT